MGAEGAISLFIIDDDYIFRTAAAVFVEQEGFSNSVEEFENGLEGFERLHALSEAGEQLPDVIFLDINMPGMNGWEFLEELKTIDPKVRTECAIFILTSSIDHGDYILSTEYDFINGYITKPLTTADLDKVKSELNA